MKIFGLGMPELIIILVVILVVPLQPLTKSKGA